MVRIKAHTSEKLGLFLRKFLPCLEFFSMEDQGPTEYYSLSISKHFDLICVCQYTKKEREKKRVALCHLIFSTCFDLLSETFSEDERAKYGPIPLGPEAAAAAEAEAERAAAEAAAKQ